MMAELWAVFAGLLLPVLTQANCELVAPKDGCAWHIRKDDGALFTYSRYDKKIYEMYTECDFTFKKWELPETLFAKNDLVRAWDFQTIEDLFSRPNGSAVDGGRTLASKDSYVALLDNGAVVPWGNLPKEGLEGWFWENGTMKYEDTLKGLYEGNYIQVLGDVPRSSYTMPTWKMLQPHVWRYVAGKDHFSIMTKSNGQHPPGHYFKEHWLDETSPDYFGVALPKGLYLYERAGQTPSDAEAWAALTADGRVRAWGHPDFGGTLRALNGRFLADGTFSRSTDNVQTARVVPPHFGSATKPENRIDKIYSGHGTFGAVTMEGALYSWGRLAVHPAASTLKTLDNINDMHALHAEYGAARVNWGSGGSVLRHGYHRVFTPSALGLEATHFGLGYHTDPNQNWKWLSHTAAISNDTVEAKDVAACSEINGTRRYPEYESAETKSGGMQPGSSLHGVCTPPPVLASGVLDVKFTELAGAALKADGSVVSWGASYAGGDPLSTCNYYKHIRGRKYSQGLHQLHDSGRKGRGSEVGNGYELHSSAPNFDFMYEADAEGFYQEWGGRGHTAEWEQGNGVKKRHGRWGRTETECKELGPQWELLAGFLCVSITPNSPYLNSIGELYEVPTYDDCVADVNTRLGSKNIKLVASSGAFCALRDEDEDGVGDSLYCWGSPVSGGIIDTHHVLDARNTLRHVAETTDSFIPFGGLDRYERVGGQHDYRNCMDETGPSNPGGRCCAVDNPAIQEILDRIAGVTNDRYAEGVYASEDEGVGCKEGWAVPWLVERHSRMLGPNVQELSTLEGYENDPTTATCPASATYTCGGSDFAIVYSNRSPILDALDVRNHNIIEVNSLLLANSIERNLKATGGESTLAPFGRADIESGVVDVIANKYGFVAVKADKSAVTWPYVGPKDLRVLLTDVEHVVPAENSPHWTVVKKFGEIVSFAGDVIGQLKLASHLW